MKIKFSGQRPSNIPTADNLREYIMFCMRCLCTQRKELPISITVRWHKTYYQKNKAYAETTQFLKRSGVPADEYEITIDVKKKTTIIHILKTLAHECTHIAQFHENRLISYDDYHVWSGIHYSCATTDYWEWPWEVEAYGQEVCVYHRWREYNKAKKLINIKEANKPKG